jgi:hypothetical protein
MSMDLLLAKSEYIAAIIRSSFFGKKAKYLLNLIFAPNNPHEKSFIVDD